MCWDKEFSGGQSFESLYGETKDISGGYSFEIFCLREGKNQKNSQAGSFEFYWKGRRETQNNLGGQSFVLLAKGEENEKDEQHKFLIKELFLKEKVLNKNFQKDEEKMNQKKSVEKS